MWTLSAFGLTYVELSIQEAAPAYYWPMFVCVFLMNTAFAVDAYRVGREKYGAVIAGGFLYVALLSPLTWYMWIHTRVANANFYYAITLVYACTQTLLSTQVARSVARFRRAGKKRD